MISSTENPVTHTVSHSELPILDFHAIEFYVGNAKQAAYFYNKLFGFDIVAYRGPETGYREAASYLLKQNNIRLVLTAGLSPEHPAVQHVERHGDGIKDISFLVSNLEEAYHLAIQRGALEEQQPTILTDESGRIAKATIGAYGDTTHTFVQMDEYKGPYEPGFKPHHVPSPSTGLKRIDHIVANVEPGKMEAWVEFYQRVFGFYTLCHFDEKDISTQYSALVSKVMANRSGSIKLPINEPAPGLGKSQIQEYLDYYHAPGVQHIAIATEDILSTVSALRQNGLELMTVPDAYYQDLAKRVGTIQESMSELAKLGILVDRDEEGYLLQIFTQPVQDRPTVFFEIIQRQGSGGFGKGNFKALFEAIERDQQRRGNL